jgi:diguanylate cyclase (GGDEF)-like protein
VNSIDNENIYSILVVDDELNNLHLLSEILSEKHYKIRRAINGSIALKSVQVILPDLILLDINLPDITGYEVCERLKSNPATQHIPIIFISALNETLDKVKAFSVGAVDYISKPFEVAEVIARIDNQLALQSARVEVQHLNSVLEQRVVERTTQLAIANQSLQQEMAERQQAQEQLVHLLLHDPLTNLPNLAGMATALEQAISRVAQQSPEPFALILLDCDRFQLVNNSLGHEAGDQILIEMSQRLKNCLPPDACVARLGGDEFMVLLNTIESDATVEQVIARIRQALVPPFRLAAQDIFVSASMGVVLGTSDYTHPQNLLRDADTAMYRAKRLGLAQHQIFAPEMHHQAQVQLHLETDLRQAIDHEYLRLHYQPILSLKTGQITGFEALVRWQHPIKGMVSPAAFIPIAEETGLIIPIGLWVLKEACQQLKRWQQEFPQQTGLKISVNCSIRQFLDPHLIEQIDQIIKDTGIEGASLNLEITESALMENANRTADLLWQLKSRNIQLAIDDFGTGYSSLSYLHRLPVDTLKVDQSFIRQLLVADSSSGRPGLNQNFRIVQSTINLAHDLDLDVVAEGIELPEQLEALKSLNCDFGQGYFWAKPLEAQAAGNLLRQQYSAQIENRLGLKV